MNSPLPDPPEALELGGEESNVVIHFMGALALLQLVHLLANISRRMTSTP